MKKKPEHYSDFAQKVRAVVAKIPRGSTMTYGEVARRAESPRAARAVGSLMSKNFNPTIPCHRVIRSDLPAPRPDTYCIYVIMCGNGAFYIGQTNDLQKRWQEHRDGVAADYTKRFGARRIIHYERYRTREAAVAREKALKTGFGRKWLKREYLAGRTRQAGGRIGNYNRGGESAKRRLLMREGSIL